MASTAQNMNDHDKENIVNGLVSATHLRSETQSPRRMKDIHLDGNVDDMQNVNPYLLDERDLDIRSDVGGATGSVSSVTSARSLSARSAKNSRKQKPNSAGTSLPMRSNAGSRARQIKEHESAPFLSVDMMQDSSHFSPELIRGKLSRSSLRESHHSSLLSVSTTGLTSNSVKSSFEAMPSARGQRAKLFSSTSVVPPGKRSSQPNHNIKMPFKHSIKKPENVSSSCSPAIGLKDRTFMATHTLNKLLHAQKPSRTTYIQGRLLKARLKPLEPVKMTTPTIHQCRGIISETRQYGKCDSRTLQRWQAIMAGNHQVPAMNIDVRDGASTCESIHQTSQASTPECIDFGLSFDPDELINMLNGNEDDLEEELEGPINGNSLRPSSEVPPPFSLPNSRCAPSHCGEDLTELSGPDMQMMNKAPPLMTALISETVKVSPLEQNDLVSQDEKENGDKITTDSTESSGTSDVQNEDDIPLSKSKRPKSANYPQESMLLHSRMNSRPKTAVDVSRKAVRFADENGPSKKKHTDCFIPTDETNNVRKNGKSKNGKSSCKPHSLDSGFDDRDDKGDGDEDNHGGAGGRGGNKCATFLTQRSDLNASSGVIEQKGRGSQGNGKHNSGVTKDSISSTSTLSLNHELSTGKSFSTKSNESDYNSCLSATVCYADNTNKKVKGTSVPSKQVKNTVAGIPSQKAKMIRKTGPEGSTKSNADVKTKSQEKNVNPKSVIHNKDSNKLKDVLKEKDDENLTSKLMLCKQESSDSGISDTAKEDENTIATATESQNNAEGFVKSTNNLQATNKIVKTIRPSSSSMKRVKAYKNLITKSKKGNVRPYSGSVYEDVEIVDRKNTRKQIKDSRPGSAMTCSDISQIQSKYGLNTGRKTTPSATKKHILSASSTSSKGKKSQDAISELASLTAYTAQEVESNNPNSSGMWFVNESHIIEGIEDKNDFRPKSATKVTFARENEYEDDRISRKSSAKSCSRTSSILRSSSSSNPEKKSSYPISKGDKSYDGEYTDYERMWDELPDDNSDIEKSGDESYRYDNYDDEDNEDNDSSKLYCDDFMSKFDVLEKQLNTVTEELAVERSKYQDTATLPSSSSQGNALVVFNDENQPTPEEDPYFVTEEEMAVIRASGYKIESSDSDRIFVTDDSTVINANRIAHLNENQTGDDGQKSLKSSTGNEFVQYEEPEWQTVMNGWVGAMFSSNLYKKTNRYVEVKPLNENDLQAKNDKNALVSSKIDHGQKKLRMGSKYESKKYETKDNESKSGMRTSVFKMDEERPSSVHILIPNMDHFPFSCEGTPKPTCQRSSRATTPVFTKKLRNKGHNSRPTSASVGSDNVLNGYDERQLCMEQNFQNDDMSSKCTDVKNGKTAPSFNVDGKNSVMATGEDEIDYYNLLLAYRSHCMEDSDNDDEDEDDEYEYVDYKNNMIYNDNEKANNSNHLVDKKNSNDDEDNKKMNDEADCCEMKNGKAEIKNRNIRHDQHNETMTETTQNFKKVNDQVTNEFHDGDCQTNKMRPNSAVTNDSGVDSDIQTESEGGPISVADQSEKNKRNNSTSRSRPDSGVSSIDGQDGECQRDDLGMNRDGGQSVALEIVASAKSLTSTRPSSARHSSDAEVNMEELSKLPPLCFKLNAKAPAGFLYYFAYGPNMNADRISCYLGCQQSPPRFWAILFGFGIVFNMKGSTSCPEQPVGLPNLEWSPQMSVEGCVYQITPAQLERLDKFIGYPKSFEHVILPVWMSNSLDPDALGVAQYCVPALTYIAKDKYTWKEPVPASDYSVSQCIKSADLVTPEFKEHLNSFYTTTQDYDIINEDCGLNSNSPLAITASA